jgi:hypothetical protein
MNTSLRRSCVLLCALAAAGMAAQAAQPPDVVQSDGNGNTAMGSYVLANQGTAYYNTGAGWAALYLTTTGSYNTAFGGAALFENTGSFNTAVGTFALELNGSASGNTAVGYAAAVENSSGGDNTAVGYEALYSNSSGDFNVAIGQGALQANVSGFSNTAIGETALISATGSNNIAIGEKAGLSLTTGSSNIYIGNSGANESGVIRIGNSFQSAAYIAGVSGTQVTGSAVYVTSSGQLGVLASSERFKTSVAPMGGVTTGLERLRPVTFRLKSDPTGTRQFGLIAEEVAKVYPELVIRDRLGKIQGIRYEELSPMLLNEVQRQARLVKDQEQRLARIDGLERRLQRQEQELKTLERQNEMLQTLLTTLTSKNQTVAMR